MKRIWDVYVVYHEPSITWEMVTSDKDAAERMAAKLGDGYKVAEGGIGFAPHAVPQEA